MNYRMAYQGSGHPILSWKNGPPRQTRAADTVALGSTLSEPTLVLPRPGAPEPINGLGDVMASDGGYLRARSLGRADLQQALGRGIVRGAMGGCGCAGTCGGCGTSAMSGIADTISGLSPAAKIAGAVGLYFVYKKLKKRR